MFIQNTTKLTHSLNPSFHLLLHIFTSLIISKPVHTSNQQPITIIIASRNNASFYMGNLDSVTLQQYDNYKVIYIDDASTDNTASLVEEYVSHNHILKTKFTLIKNKERIGQLGNYYKAIHELCNNNDIIVQLDGDDQLANSQVLTTINQVYTTKNCLVTYGSFKFSSNGAIFPSSQRGLSFQQALQEGKNIREIAWVTSHLRTFKAWLFKRILLEDLTYNNEFIQISTDQATMFPLLEMARNRAHFIEDVLYIYNESNPQSFHHSKREEQLAMEKTIRTRKAYEPLK